MTIETMLQSKPEAWRLSLAMLEKQLAGIGVAMSGSWRPQSSKPDENGVKAEAMYGGVKVGVWVVPLQNMGLYTAAPKCYGCILDARWKTDSWRFRGFTGRWLSNPDTW